MGYESLEKIEIFQIAERICDRFHTLVQQWSSFDKNTTGIQLVRAADSIGANIAESYGRYHYGERLNFLYYARGSLYEAKYWVRRANRRNLMPGETCTNALKTLDELALKLNAYIKEKRKQRHYSQSLNNRVSEMAELYIVDGIADLSLDADHDQ